MTRLVIAHTLSGLTALLVLSLSLTSCSTSGGYTGGSMERTLPASRMKSAAVVQRNQLIASEPQGDYFIGRRWFADGTRFWGYVRKPGQPWEQARLVVMNESIQHQPDRVPETPTDGSHAHGFDHNHEYRLWGNFNGKQVYDPNSNLELPEFVLQKYQLMSTNPGFLFYPNEPYDKRGLPPKHPATL